MTVKKDKVTATHTTQSNKLSNAAIFTVPLIQVVETWYISLQVPQALKKMLVRQDAQDNAQRGINAPEIVHVFPQAGSHDAGFQSTPLHCLFILSRVVALQIAYQTERLFR